jgi:hypothetical protein
MLKRYANQLKFVTFSVRPKNKLAYLVYPTNDFTRIDATKLSEKFPNWNLDKVILVFVTNYRTATSLTLINKNLALLTLSIEEFLEETSSFNLIFNTSADKNIVFVFKDIEWIHVSTKIRKLNYTLITPYMEMSPVSFLFARFLNCIDRLIGYPVFKAFGKAMDTKSDKELRETYDKVVPLDEDKDLQKESILIFNSETSTTLHTDIAREIDEFLY